MILHNNKSKQTKMYVYSKRHTMKLSRSHIIVYMLTMIAVLMLILALLNCSTEKSNNPLTEGLDEIKPAIGIQPKKESDILPKSYIVELIQTKDTTTPKLPSLAATQPEIFNPETAYYINTVSANNPTADNKSAIFKVDQPSPIVLHMETAKAVSFIAIAPQEGGKFPPKFTFTLTNNIEANKLSMDLWGTSPTAANVPSNSIVGSDNYAGYPYPKEIFQTKDKSGKLVDGLLVGGVNIGNSALNIIGVGRIFDRNFTDIGEVQNLGDKITIECTESKGLTGIFIYLGKAETK
jgi:hypothetical protein